MNDADVVRKKTQVALLSVLSNATLVVLKIVIGLLMSSVSVISEAIHSGVDLTAAVIALFAVRISSQPADKEHPFGHGKVENVSGTVEALLIFLAGAWIIYESVKRLRHPAPIEELGWGVAVMLASSLVNVVVSQMLFKVGRETSSVALLADAWHLRTDVYTSTGVMAGLGLIWAGSFIWPGRDFRWIDPVAAIAVALLIFKAAYDLTTESARDLLDVALTDEELEIIKREIVGMGPEVRGFHGLRTRKSGSERFAELHIQVDSELSVDASHRIAEEASARIKKSFEKMYITIHVEPCAGECSPRCIEGCLLTLAARTEARARHQKKT